MFDCESPPLLCSPPSAQLLSFYMYVLRFYLSASLLASVIGDLMWILCSIGTFGGKESNNDWAVHILWPSSETQCDNKQCGKWEKLNRSNIWSFIFSANQPFDLLEFTESKWFSHIYNQINWRLCYWIIVSTIFFLWSTNGHGKIVVTKKFRNCS